MRWKNPFINENNYQKTVFFLLSLTLVSLAFSVRILNSLSLIILVVVTLIHPNRLKFLKKAFSDRYFIFCLLLYAVKIAGIFYTDHLPESLKQITGKGIWLAIPFFFCANGALPVKTMHRLMIYFSCAILIVSMACLVIALAGYSEVHDSKVFFYHELVRPFKHHAVLFSFYLLFCIIYWIESGLSLSKNKVFRTFVLSLIIYFYFFIFLLSSKLVILIALGYLLYAMVVTIKKKSGYVIIIGTLLIITSISAILLTNNPVKRRFSDAISGNVYLFKQDKFSPDIYFNGVQLRLLIWRFTYEILQQDNAWLIGVSTGDAQHELNRRFEETNVYLGDGEKDKLGYRVFNCHNVFLQTTLESGLIGLCFLLGIIFTFLIQAFKKQDKLAMIFFLAILAFCFTESVLSSQYTILLFMFFPLLSLNVQNKIIED